MSFTPLLSHCFISSTFSVGHHLYQPFCLFLLTAFSVHVFVSFDHFSPSSLLTLPSYLSTFSNFPQHLCSAIQISCFFSLPPSQVTPVRPLIRILSLSKCIVTVGWQLRVCVRPCACECVTVWAGCWRWQWQPPGIFTVARCCSSHWPDSHLNYTEDVYCVCMCVRKRLRADH